MFCKERKHLERMKTGRFVEAAALFEMLQGDPGVVRIPNDRRNRTEGENEQEQIQVGPQKFPT